MRRFEFYKTFRFVIEVPGKGKIGATAAFSDPFTDSFWIGRGHEMDHDTLEEILSGTSCINVYMFARMRGRTDDGTVARRISVSFSKLDWYPLDLDATSSEVALDWVMLRNATYTSCEDLKAGDIPPLVPWT